MSDLGLLPEGWAQTSLDGVISISSGKGLTKSKMIEGDIPVFGGNGITGWHNNSNIEKKTIAIGRVGFYCGSVHLTPNRAWITDNAFITSFDDNLINQKFLYLLLTSTDLRQNDSSTAQPVISGAKIYPIEITLPPLAEQKVIANKLDELLAQVESTKARLDAIPAILKSFRQSVLAAAVSGKLIPSSGSKAVTVGEVAADMRYGTSKKSDYNGGAIPVIRIPNIGNRKLDITDLKSADFTDKELEKLTLQENDLLVIRSNGSINLVAKPALVEKQYAGFLFAGYLIRIRCDQEQVLPSFLLNVLCSRVVRDVVEIGARSTSGVNNINSKELASLKFVLPQLDEQAEIVRRVEELFAFADKVEAQVNAAQVRVNKLSQSILAKAFRGELTADWRAANPALISGENSAEALLERIKAEREALALAVKAAKKPAKKPRAKKAKA